MTDNLVERLLNWERVYDEDYDKPEGSLYLEAADRIEELEAKLAKAVTRLQHIAANKTTDELTVIEWDTYDMFTILNACISEARTTLAELTGGNDE